MCVVTHSLPGKRAEPLNISPRRQPADQMSAARGGVAVFGSLVGYTTE